MKSTALVVLVGGVALLGIVVLMSKKTTAVVQAKTGIPTTTTGSGVTVDAAGNYWFGGAIVWKAPTQSWST